LMRVCLIAPHYFPPENGNAVTVRRIERSLQLLGCEVRVLPVDCMSGAELLAAVTAFNPQLLHAFHGYHGGRMANALAQQLGLPYIVTLTGTDVYQALDDHRSFDTHAALKGAARLVAFHAYVKRRLGEHLPSFEERTVVIAQGVELPHLPSAPVARGENCTFLLPAGLRPVKNVLFTLSPLACLQAVHPGIRLLLVGPVLDPEYAAEVMEALEKLPFAEYLGTVNHDAMGNLYRAADVVLNSSLVEGGMANAVLEGLAFAKPVLVSDIEGNRSIIKECATGMLFRDADEFYRKAEQLVTDPALRERLGYNGRKLVREMYPPEREGKAYLELYQSVVQ
jgi:L-malate glycosyltransferase